MKSMDHLDELARDSGEVFAAKPPRGAQMGAWRIGLVEPCGEFLRCLRACYGHDDALLGRRRKLWLRLLDRFESAFGSDGEVFLLGVPSRINWEGHHVDHQGGSYNATTDEREMVAVVRARSDRGVRIVNVACEQFPDAGFTIDGEVRKGAKGEWDRFVQGALIALQQTLGGFALRGMDMAVGSDIPIGAGLSSSHALVLASALGACAANRVQLDKRHAVVLVQQGEWFVGSRTGLGDQATMVFGKRDQILCSPVIEPDEIAPRYVELPADHARVLIHSFTHHKLAGADGLAYNARVFAYKCAFPLVLSSLCELDAEPEDVRTTRRLAHIGPDRYPLASIYRALAALPDRMTLTEAERLFDRSVRRLGHGRVPPPKADFPELVRTYFGDGPRPEFTSVKGVALYGLAECWRSRHYAELLDRGDLEIAGRLVYAGHEGDRVAQRDRTGAYVPCDHSVTNERLLALAEDVQSGDRGRMDAAALEYQSGDYRASIPELDRIVDMCRDAGAVSASLTGAGLGGVVTAMIRTDLLPALKQRVWDHYVQQEEQEVLQIEAAQAAGLVSDRGARAARNLQAAKRAAGAADAPFEPDPDWIAALEEARHLKTSQGDTVVRLVPVDYRRDGLVENGSIAGAGYLAPPQES